MRFFRSVSKDLRAENATSQDNFNSLGTVQIHKKYQYETMRSVKNGNRHCPFKKGQSHEIVLLRFFSSISSFWSH